VLREKWEFSPSGWSVHCLICNNCIAAPGVHLQKVRIDTNHRSRDNAYFKTQRLGSRGSWAISAIIQKSSVAPIPATIELIHLMVAVNGKPHSDRSQDKTHSFSRPLFLWGGSRGRQPQEDSEQQSLIAPLAPDQNRTKQGRRCSHSNWFLDDLWATFPVGSC